MTTEPRHPNPFVGLRPIVPPHRLYGRETETRELFQLLTSRRIVVLHAPSGAGKSSLIHAGLVPMLSEARFDGWPPIRVNLDPRELGELPDGVNRYLLSTMVSLEDPRLPPERRRTAAQLAEMGLAASIATRPRKKGREGSPVVLIFDQFEELLTTAPYAITEKERFFDELGDVLRADEQLCALFVMREDYLGAFAPYRSRLPTRMSHTFHLPPLGREAARGVLEALAASGGRTFPAAGKLVDDLSRVRAQQPDGSFVEQEGPFVEPFQLQVVGHRLWTSLPDDVDVIDETRLKGDASAALSTYYDETVATLAAGVVSAERDIRDWVGSRLIAGEARSTVRRGAGSSGGLANGVIARLVASYLVRMETRGGADWYELSHDRLVAPVLASNRAWTQDHPDRLRFFQLQARLWEDQGRPTRLLLTEEEHRAFVSDGRPEGLSSLEAEFLERSRYALYGNLDEAEWRAQALERNQVLVTLFVVGLVLTSVVRSQSDPNVPTPAPRLAGSALALLGITGALLWRYRATFVHRMGRRVVLGVLAMFALASANRVLVTLDYLRMPWADGHPVRIDPSLVPPPDVGCAPILDRLSLCGTLAYPYPYDLWPTAKVLTTEELLVAAMCLTAAIMVDQLEWMWKPAVLMVVAAVVTRVSPQNASIPFLLATLLGFVVMIRASGQTPREALARFLRALSRGSLR